VAKLGLGTKRLCPHCGAKFYDLEKNPIVCPKCGSVVELAPVRGGGRSDAARAPVAAKEAEPAETQDAEFVSLEDADAEASGKKVKAEGGDDDDAVEDDDTEDTFLEEDEDEDEDVSDIIGGDIETEEET
jgi:uncharacterized protein (TIGR02300 family)